MNGPTDVTAPIHPTPEAPSSFGARTDTPLPLGRPAPEIVTAARPAPVAASDRIISGLDLIDYGAGGLMPNHVYLVKGPSGVGKTTVGLQYLVRGLEHEEPGILITDQKPENVVAHARSLGFGIDEAVRRNQLVILNPSGRYFDLVESPADVMAIVEELADAIRHVGARRLVIDPIYTLINTSYSSHFALAITQSLLNALEDLDSTVLLISSDEEKSDLNPVLRALEQNAFGVIELSLDAATGGRIMKLEKLRYATTENLSAHYRILKGRGIINYRGENEVVADVTQPWENAAPESRSVLLLGAQPETIRRVREALGSEYEVQAESDLRSGVDRVRRERPSLVLVTPSRGADTVRTLLDIQSGPSSIAFLSPAGNRQSDRVLYLRAGADDFIAEPFTPAELRARVDALIRRSGRRLTIRDRSLGQLTSEELSALLQNSVTPSSQRGPVIASTSAGSVSFDSAFADRLDRSVATVSKFDQPFAVYWIKGNENDRELNRSLAKLCRQEDIVCHNRNGEFVAILTGVDENGVRGFETRLREKLGDTIERVKKGHSLHKPGDMVGSVVRP